MKYLIAGLGNIGEEYHFTRHNVGFEIIDALAQKQSAKFSQDRFAFMTDFKFKGKFFCLIKPTTYMNLSGKAIKYWLSQLKIPTANLLVVIDDIALPFGSIRIKAQGNNGGHNGLKNIDELLSTNVYPRLRFGIGNDFPKGRQVEYVLGKWTENEQKELPSYINTAVEAILSFGTIGLERTMNQFNKT